MFKFKGHRAIFGSVVGVALVSSLLLAGCGTAATSSNSSAATNSGGSGGLQTVTIADDKGISEAGVYLADDLGYFKDQGIQIKFQTYSSGSDELTNLATSKVDVATGILNTGFFNAEAQNMGIKIVADSGRNTPGKPYFGLVMKKGENVPDFAALKGKNIAIVAKGSVNELMLDQALAKGGLTENDIKISVVDGFSDMLGIIQNGSVDGAMLIEPLISVGIQQGIIQPPMDAQQYSPNEQIAVLMFSQQFAQNKDLGTKFMTAYLKGVRAYDDAFVYGNKNQDQIAKILLSHTALKDVSQIKAMNPVFIDPNGQVDQASIGSEQDWYAKTGTVTTKTPVDQMVDASFAQNAVKSLGEYQKP